MDRSTSFKCFDLATKGAVLFLQFPHLIIPPLFKGAGVYGWGCIDEEGHAPPHQSARRLAMSPRQTFSAAATLSIASLIVNETDVPEM